MGATGSAAGSSASSSNIRARNAVGFAPSCFTRSPQISSGIVPFSKRVGSGRSRSPPCPTRPGERLVPCREVTHRGRLALALRRWPWRTDPARSTSAECRHSALQSEQWFLVGVKMGRLNGSPSYGSLCAASFRRDGNWGRFGDAPIPEHRRLWNRNLWHSGTDSGSGAGSAPVSAGSATTVSVPTCPSWVPYSTEFPGQDGGPPSAGDT